MSIAEKLTTVAENVPKVYEAGKKAEYDDFWDAYQRNGTRTNYHTAFRTGWTDAIYNPKYPIVCSSNNSATSMFTYTSITDTKVPITISGNNTGVFYGASSLVTVYSLDVSGVTANIGDWFMQCPKLANIKFVGVIPMGMDISACPLTAQSLVSIVEHLSSTTSGKTLIVKASAVNNADWSTTDYESWDALIATKPNWTFSKA